MLDNVLGKANQAERARRRGEFPLVLATSGEDVADMLLGPASVASGEDRIVVLDVANTEWWDIALLVVKGTLVAGER